MCSSDLTGINVSTIDSTSAGDKKLAVNYLDKTIDYNVKVLGINSLSLSGVPTKIMFGQAHDISNMTAELVYSAEKRVSVAVSSLAITPINVNLAGEQTFKAVYTDQNLGEITATVTVAVVGVKEMTVIGVKNEILVGEALDTSNISLSVTYTDDTTAHIETGINVSTIDSTSAGDKKLAVTYLDKTIDFDVKVIGINSLALSGVPKTVNVGEAHDISNMIAELVYSATKRIAVDVNSLDITPINVNLPGEQTFKVAYTDPNLGEFTATVQVLVIGVKDISVTAFPTASRLSVIITSS